MILLEIVNLVITAKLVLKERIDVQVVRMVLSLIQLLKIVIIVKMDTIKIVQHGLVNFVTLLALSVKVQALKIAKNVNLISILHLQ